MNEYWILGASFDAFTFTRLSINRIKMRKLVEADVSCSEMHKWPTNLEIIKVNTEEKVVWWINK